MLVTWRKTELPVVSLPASQ